MGLLPCDDGNLINGDGCSSTCQIEVGWSCTGGSLTSPDRCTEICGDGLFFGVTTACNDGNLANGDGCSATCTVEQGWTCSYPNGLGTKSLCYQLNQVSLLSA